MAEAKVSVLGDKYNELNQKGYAVKVMTPDGVVKVNFVGSSSSYERRRKEDGTYNYHLKYQGMSSSKGVYKGWKEEVKDVASKHLHEKYGILTRHRSEKEEIEVLEI